MRLVVGSIPTQRNEKKYLNVCFHFFALVSRGTECLNTRLSLPTAYTAACGIQREAE